MKHPQVLVSIDLASREYWPGPARGRRQSRLFPVLLAARSWNDWNADRDELVDRLNMRQIDFRVRSCSLFSSLQVVKQNYEYRTFWMAEDIQEMWIIIISNIFVGEGELTHWLHASDLPLNWAASEEEQRQTSEIKLVNLDRNFSLNSYFWGRKFFMLMLSKTTNKSCKEMVHRRYRSLNTTYRKKNKK